jgi:membrane-bound lytic murein transglycosylase D
MYGMKEAKILRKNRMASASSIKPGLVLWLRFIRPSKEPVSYSPVVAYQKDELKDNPAVPVSRSESSAETETTIPKKETVFKKKTKVNIDATNKNTNNSQKEIIENFGRPNEAKESKTNAIEPVIEESNVKNTQAEPAEKNELNKIIKAEPADSVVNIKIQNETGAITEAVKEDEKFEAESVSFVQVGKTETIEVGSQDPHVVRQGETLYGIARAYSIPLNDLARWNNLKFDEGIKIGQVLTLVSPKNITKEEPADVRNNTENVQEQYISHKVIAGETLYKIAREHNVTIKEVMEWNKKTDFSVALGEVIKIKKLIVNE